MAVLLLAAQAGAAIPKKIAYQGKLVDASGNPSPGDHTIFFSLHNAESGGIMVWSETQTVTADSNGVFSAILGSNTPIEGYFAAPKWLSITVDGEPLAPRREIVSVASAFTAANADSLGGLAPGAYALGTHTHYSLTASDGDPSDALYVNADGRVGIGTTSLNSQLRVVNSASASGTIAIVGSATSAAEIESYGIRGETYSTSSSLPGAAVLGIASAATGAAYGVRGETNAQVGGGVFGWATHTTGVNYGVKGHTSSSNGYAAYFTGGRNYFQGKVGIGTQDPVHQLHVETSSAMFGTDAIYGLASTTSTAQQVSGILGETRTTDSVNPGAGVWGLASAETGRAVGVRGDGEPATGTGVYGWATHDSGVNYGVMGKTDSPNGYAGYFLGGKNYFEGNVGVRTTAPTATMDISGSTGYNQVRMRTSYTPTSTTDSNGSVGDMAWDDNFIYIKTTAGWKRAALSLFGL